MRVCRLAAGILSIFLALGPVVSVHAQGPTQVWVDDDYCPSCANDGHAWGKTSFASISAALEAVAAGGTVHVLPGHYEEDLRIQKPCALLGEGTSPPVLAPRLADVTLTIAANDVTVQGLEVWGGQQAAILILGPDFQREPARRVAVRQNVVRGGRFGVAANIDPLWSYGQVPATDLVISDNTVSGCTRAIYVYNAQAEISHNTVSELAPEGIGIYSSEGSQANIRDNRVDVQAPDGRAIYILDNQGTFVDGNMLVGATDILTPTTAFALYGYTDLVLSNNTVQGFYWGTSAYTGGTARIVGNTFRDTVAWALSLGTAVTTTQVLIADNLIRGSYWGLKLDDDGGYGLQAIVEGNTFTDNVVGILLASSVQDGQVQVHGNSICGNLAAGLRNESQAPVDATDNWWGANDGPKPEGLGDRVEGIGGALTNPWVRLETWTRLLADGRVAIVADLKSVRYRLRNQHLTFSTDRGAFEVPASIGKASASLQSQPKVTLSPLDNQAEATLLPLHGNTAHVTVSSDCGQGVTISVR